MLRAFLAAGLFYAAAASARDVVVSPKPIHDVLPNPGMGIESCGDDPWPGATVACRQWTWAALEPERGLPRWDLIVNALAAAHQRGQTLSIRLAPYDEQHALPPWCRKSALNDPAVLQHWSEVVAEAGRRFDGHPDLETIDIPSTGSHQLIDLWFDAFPGTRLLANVVDPQGAAYAIGRGAGWHFDGLDSQFHRPESIIQDAWKRSPVYLETSDAARILDEALRLHVTVLHIKSGKIPPQFASALESFERRIGYRLELRHIEYPSTVSSAGNMPIKMQWLNSGVAPIYRPYAPALELDSPGQCYTVDISADPRKWLPGDTTTEQEIKLPQMKSGDYRLRVALLDPITNKPAVRLAIAGRLANGWYDLGAISVR